MIVDLVISILFLAIGFCCVCLGVLQYDKGKESTYIFKEQLEKEGLLYSIIGILSTVVGIVRLLGVASELGFLL